jgi:hypothetical protein
MREDASLNDNTINPRRRGNNVSLNFDKKPTSSSKYNVILVHYSEKSNGTRYHID